jgi:transcriptional regulator with XRE-family HTH domain
MITLEALGNKIKLLRERFGFSQEYTAEYLGVNRQAVIAIESGKRKVDSFELFKMAELFDVDVKDLILNDNVQFSSFKDAVLLLRKKEQLSDHERKALIEFQQICEDYNFLKNLQL